MKRHKNIPDAIAVMILTVAACALIYGFGFICYDMYRHEPAMLLMFPGFGAVLWAMARLGDDKPVKKRSKRSSK